MFVYIGVGIGVVILLVAGGGFIYCFLCKRKHSQPIAPTPTHIAPAPDALDPARAATHSEANCYYGDQVFDFIIYS